jgi:hypothetical protein
MGLFINEQSQRAGTGSAEGFTKVRGPVPGDRDSSGKSHALRGRRGQGRGTEGLSEQQAMVPF